MLADGKVDSLDTHLEQFKLNEQNRQNDLQNLLREYGQLLDDYKVLKKAFEEKGTKTRAEVPTIARAQKNRNPYVLVLVDGNGYIFNDELIREKEEGGMHAARMLNDAVEKYLQQSVPEARTSRVIVRIYADLTNLSKQLAKSKVTGLEKRSIAPFSAAFTRAISLFDFVDALDEEGTKFKIREQLNLASEDTACSHILYAACHDSAYLSQLVPLSGERDKITLVQGAGWNPEFHQFNLNITQFPTVFRWSGLPTNVPNTSATANNGPTGPRPRAAQKATAPPRAQGPRLYENWQNGSISPGQSTTEPDWASSTDTNGFGGNGVSLGTKPVKPSKSSQLPCKYFQKGYCQYGQKCKFEHVPNSINSTTTSTKHSPGIVADRSNVSANLPTSTISGFIPLNKDGQRLDTYTRPPTQEEWRIYNTRFHKQKPCNSFHLQRICTSFGCPFDHNELEPESRHVLEYVLKCSPCPRRSDCRVSDCFYGHICHKDDCTGQMKGCRMKTDLHNVDPKVASMVPAEDDPEHGEPLDMPDGNNFLW
ncbi:Nn.00g048030.m01.CDS01 [Neocucurbitaria sp. VM-36]